MYEHTIYRITNLPKVKNPTPTGKNKGFFFLANKYLVVTEAEVVNDAGLEKVVYENDSFLRKDILRYFRKPKVETSDSKKELYKLISIPSTPEHYDNLKREVLECAEKQRMYFVSEFTCQNYFSVYKKIISQMIVADIDSGKDPQENLVKLLKNTASLRGTSEELIARENLYILSILGEVDNLIESFVTTVLADLSALLMTGKNEIDRGLQMNSVFDKHKDKLEKEIVPLHETYEAINTSHS